jgi:glycosyltransferase involved in cell wall biosynthesis
MSFLGERSDVPDLLPGLDVFAMASRYEGLPCAIVEAMAAARPVVATAVNAVPNVVISGETGLLVPPGQPDLLGRAVEYLIENPAVAARLGRAGRAHLGDELSPAALGTVLDETYRVEPIGERSTQRGELEVLTS